MRIHYSRHAKNNMRLYKIRHDEVESAVEMPNFKSQEEERTVAIKSFKGRFADYPLKVVYSIERETATIITAYPLRKSKRRIYNES